MVSSQFHYTKRNRFMPFLLAEILNFQGSTHRIGVGSFSNKVSNTSTSKKSDNAKTGDATNIWGWVSMAVASLGAGGLGFKLRGRKKKDDEE